MALFKGPGKVWIALLCFSLSVTNSVSISVSISGTDSGFAEDFEAFTCSLEGEKHLSHKTDIQWKYLLKSGNLAPVNETDMLLPLEKRTFSEKLTVTSFIKLRPDMEAIVCEYSTESKSQKVSVTDLVKVTSDDEPCKKSKESGKPIVVMYTSSLNFVAPYRNGHYLNGNGVQVSYPFEVSQTKLICVSGSDDSPRWTIEPGTADKMRFAAWYQNTFGLHSCKRQVLDVLEVVGKPGQNVGLSFECEAGSSSSGPINLKFQLPLSRSGGNPDFNQTENCVNTIVEQFYGKELTGVGLGSSFVIILMMVGMAVMKKQLNQQQKVNQDLRQAPNQSSNIPTTSTEPLHSTMESGGSSA